MSGVMPRRQLWLVLGAPLVAFLVLFVGPSAFAQDYPPTTTTTSTTIDHGQSGDHGHNGSTTTTNPHSHGNGNGHGNANGSAVAGDQSQATTTTTAGATVLGYSAVRIAGALPFTGAQLAGLVILALSLIAIGTAAVLRARRPRSTSR